MPVRNLHWLNRNELTDYPLSDTATAISDGGVRLPTGIVSDLNIRWPELYGRYAFLSAVAVGPNLVTIVVQAAESASSVSGFAPLAAVTVTRPVEEGRQYPIKPLVPGVGGWVSFGFGTKDPVFNGRFSSPAQSLLAPRAARSYRKLPITGARTSAVGAALAGLVNLKARLPLELAKEEREIDGVLRDVIVLRLTDNTGSGGFQVPDSVRALVSRGDRTVFQQFAGPCDQRPESRTCGNPQPIEFINSVPPDCDGVIEIEFTGCAVPARLLETCGAVIDCPMGLAEACTPKELPDSDGRLPSEFDPVIILPPEPPPEPDESAGVSESFDVVGSLPYLDCFQDADADSFVVKAGLWSFTKDQSPDEPCSPVSDSHSESVSLSESTVVIDVFGWAYTSNSAAVRNVSVWEGFDDTTLRRRVTTAIKLLTGPSGAKHNGGVVINYRPHAFNAGQFVYYLAELDYDTQTFRISRFNGTTFQTAVETVVPSILLDSWYKVVVDVEPGVVPAQVKITARLLGLDDPVTDVTLGPLSVSNFVPSTGTFGFGSDRALSRFAYFQVEERT